MRGRNSDKNAIKRLLSAPSTHEPAKNKKVHKAQRGRIAPTLVISAKIKKTTREPITNKGNGRKLPSNPKTNKPTQGKNP
jgi:hypothetical protein